MVEVLKTGLYDTIQDIGRFGVQKYGIPFSGVMDLQSATISNTVLGNSISDSILEITMTGPKLLFHCDIEIALAGADLSPKINSKTIKMNTRIHVTKNDILTFGKRNYGSRAYLAVKGGFQTEYYMNSYSMYGTLTKQSKLIKGDQLLISEVSDAYENINASIKIDKTHFNVSEIKVFKGMEFNCLSKIEQNTLLSTKFTISKDSNRMAYHVNETLENTIEPIITSLVLPGTVQLTPSGKLMILMRDCQTTGGYPRILQVSEAAINHLSQKGFGEKFRLKCID
ncbi:5-oxoprolinase subunit C family protein [Psychroserpens ponticola]|uniref:Biotin-dependent carboxyltransferase family protein n=1 Tax=Psychroserpens ponticola TaxID=2932268 RepID=A0ABY7RTI6_9FLAO|nr:biotin-dependent carboxyltransferase family protein [Psychroserpens ponticola]WCO00417.1 biotin-dependent carboxyltransferase family protein [Psychroserpens ponticola]